MTTQEKGDSLVKQYKATYELLIDIFVKSYDTNDIESSLSTIACLANFAWKFHPGRFVDVRLEYWAAKIGFKIWETNKRPIIVPSSTISKQRVLHVASETYEVGGHTRLILNMIKGDEQSTHSLVLTRQKIVDVPAQLHKAVINSGGALISLLPDSLADQVFHLQKLLCYQTDKVFYHIHPDDSVAVAALAALPRPQVMTINHADHVFWLGSALSDIVVCIRNWSLDFSLSRREAQNVTLLPIPLNFAVLNSDVKKSAREKLGIKSGEIILLTVATFFKFIPSGKYNYFKTIKSVLDKNANVSLKIIGISPSDDLSQVKFEPHERVELLGVLSNPADYYQAADIYIDAMPFSSFTSLYEAMYFGCFPVLPFDPVDKFRLDQDPALKGLVIHARDEDEEISFIQRAIDDSIYRQKIATAGQSLVENNYMGEGWKSYLRTIYNSSVNPVTELRNLANQLDSVEVIAEDDIDSAILSNSFHYYDNLFIYNIVNKKIKDVTFFSLIKIFLFLKSENNKTKQRMSLRQLIWIMRLKLKNL